MDMCTKPTLVSETLHNITGTTGLQNLTLGIGAYIVNGAHAVLGVSHLLTTSRQEEVFRESRMHSRRAFYISISCHSIKQTYLLYWDGLTSIFLETLCYALLLLYSPEEPYMNTGKCIRRSNVWMISLMMCPYRGLIQGQLPYGGGCPFGEVPLPDRWGPIGRRTQG